MVQPSFCFRFAIAMLLPIAMANSDHGQESGTAQGPSQMSCEQIAVLGAVRSPTFLKTQRRLRLLEVLAIVGGPTERAGKIIRIVHSACSESGMKAGGIHEYDLAEVLHGRESENPYVVAGEIVVIPESDSVFVVGNVRKQRGLAVSEGMTVTRAIALVGGVGKSSGLVTVRVHRNSSGGPRRDPIIVRLSAIIQGRTEDVLLQPWDIVEVSDDFGHFQSPKLSPPTWDPPLLPRKDNSCS